MKVQAAIVPEESQVQWLQSSMKGWLGSHLNPGALTGIFSDRFRRSLEGGGQAMRVQRAKVPEESQVQRLQSSMKG